jgi:mono/diheme cytochrome c family protein/glucose/arabinose dehydrogenase
MRIAGTGHRLPATFFLALLIGFAPLLRAQRTTTRPATRAYSLPTTRTYSLPPTAPLSPQEEIRTMEIPPGYRVECVAAEPLVHDPIAMSIDPDGRLWVCEMRGFMPDLNEMNEMKPVGTVSVLEDTDGDGVFDKSTVFVDKLVLPRAVCWTTDGLLVAENGHIWLCRDTKGGLHCDEKTLIAEYYPGNLEHALNGLVPMLDNWLYCANASMKFRKVDGKWQKESTAPRGQWGITQDDHGYLVYNVNAQLIRGDLIPCYSLNAKSTNPLVNAQLFKEQQVWPIRPNPGINRGYLASFLRPDGTMIEANADCGPVVYRGDNLPSELKGNVFIPEPAGNLVRRQIIIDDHGIKTSQNAYDKKEFIASTDERFRPVNMYNAPDGTMYLVDMYRGVIQDGAFITDYLVKDSKDRGLEKPIGLGRIFRIAHETSRPRKPPALSKATSEDLVMVLASPNGWHRDVAQQLLVGRNDASIVPNLRTMAASSSSPLGRLHALWTLEGMGKITSSVLTTAMKDADADVRSSGVSLSRSLAMRAGGESPFTEVVEAAAADPDKVVRMQVVFSLGLINSEAANRAVDAVLKDSAADSNMLSALLAGFAGREADFLAARLTMSSWSKAEPWRVQLLRSAASLLWRQRQPLAVLRLLDLAAKQPDDQSWQQVALLEGLIAPPPPPPPPPPGYRSPRARAFGTAVGPSAPRMVTLPIAPAGLEKLRKSTDAKVVVAANKLAEHLNWPGKDGKPLPVAPPLSPEHQALYELGKNQFMNLCATCHNPAGFGEAGKAPSLLDSEWLDNDQRVVRLVLLGLRGPITIGGDPFNMDSALEMPSMGTALDDQKIAGVLTFVRREWRTQDPPIDPETVTKIRAALNGRSEQWTARELLQIR